MFYRIYVSSSGLSLVKEDILKQTINQSEINKLNKVIFTDGCICYEGIFEYPITDIIINSYYEDKFKEIYETESFKGREIDYRS